MYTGFRVPFAPLSAEVSTASVTFSFKDIDTTVSVSLFLEGSSDSSAVHAKVPLVIAPSDQKFASGELFEVGPLLSGRT